MAITALCAVTSATWTIHWFYDPFPPFLAKQVYYHTIDKTDLAPLRLINFLAIAATMRASASTSRVSITSAGECE